jgi:hypothetical protein
MTSFAYFMSVAWVLVGIVLFSQRIKHRAVIQIVIVGWLFLPVMTMNAVILGSPTALSFPGLKLTKLNTIGYALLAGALIHDRRRLFSFRPHRYDLPLAIWCICPIFSSLSNDLGWYDGISAAIDQSMSWGVLYVFGRVYFRDWQSFQDLIRGILLGAVAYMPLCWLEVRLSPQLHNQVYGFYQHEFIQTIRLGGFRPMVFLPHPLVLAMWMSAATLIAFWLWYTGTLTTLRIPLVGTLPMKWVFILLLVTCVLSKSTNALILGVAGVATLTAAKHMRTSVLLFLLLVLPPIYIAVRATGTWTGEDLVSFIAEHLSQERADSFGFRLQNENMLAEKALQQPVFGWGGWSRSRVFDAYGRDISVTDGGWIIALGERGVVGLVAWVIAVLLPTARFLSRVPPHLWSHPRLVPLAVFAVVQVLLVINSLLNVDIDPAYLVAMGGFMAVLDGLPRPRRAPVTQSELRLPATMRPAAA